MSRLAKFASRGLSQQRDPSRTVSVPLARSLRSELRCVSCVRLVSSRMLDRGLAQCAGLACIRLEENAWTVRSALLRLQELLLAPHVPRGLTLTPDHLLAIFASLDLSHLEWHRIPTTTSTTATAICLDCVLSVLTPLPVVRRNAWRPRDPVSLASTGTAKVDRVLLSLRDITHH